MKWFKKLYHLCDVPDPSTFAPIDGRMWKCLECGADWVYESRGLTRSIIFTAWWKV